MGPLTYGFAGVSLLYVGRFIVGFGIGISSFTVPIYIAEIAPHQLRGMLGTMNQMFISIGIMLVYLGGLLMNWRLLSAVGAIPGLLMVIGLFFIPETPRWLAKAGLKDQLYSYLQKLRGEDHDITEEVVEIQDISGDDISRDMSMYVGLLAVFGLLVYISSYSLGIGPVPWIVLGEILPARVRGTAGSVANLISWFSAWVVTLSFNFLLKWSASGSFWIFAAICVSNVIFVAFFVPETRGQTLEQIEASFK